ncbi:hypothetical protein FOCC_FOCC007240 [Frankliniella occidentalis]|nr:hypothetical protein FOCC_FOCC007240 [Frankliniella occidentalis]
MGFCDLAKGDWLLAERTLVELACSTPAAAAVVFSAIVFSLPRFALLLRQAHQHRAPQSSPFGSPPFGSPPFGSPPFGSPPFGSPPFGSPPSGSPPIGSPPFSSPLGSSYAYGSPSRSPYAAAACLLPSLQGSPERHRNIKDTYSRERGTSVEVSALYSTCLHKTCKEQQRQRICGSCSSSTGSAMWSVRSEPEVRERQSAAHLDTCGARAPAGTWDHRLAQQPSASDQSSWTSQPQPPRLSAGMRCE